MSETCRTPFCKISEQDTCEHSKHVATLATSWEQQVLPMGREPSLLLCSTPRNSQIRLFFVVFDSWLDTAATFGPNPTTAEHFSTVWSLPHESLAALAVQLNRYCVATD
jgi:hypothetical protein